MAVTDLAASIVTVQVAPVQSPLQLVKLEPAAGVAVRVTDEAAANEPTHVPPQLTPAGLEVTVPEPAPALVTVIV